MKSLTFLMVLIAAGLLFATVSPAEMQVVCAGFAPAGWLRIGDSWDPTKCGNPTSITYNVWTIERYDNKPAGSVMTVCSDVVPPGWSLVAQRWDPTKCGKPTMVTNNIMTIKRLEQPARDRQDRPRRSRAVALAITPVDSSMGGGETLQFQAVETDRDGVTRDATNSVSWSSSDEGVATISNAEGSKGLATAMGAGRTVISAIRSGITSSTSLQVPGSE